MKKILLLCDGEHFPLGAMRFLLQIGATEPLYVKGMFFTPSDIPEMIPMGFMPVTGPYATLMKEEKRMVDESQTSFIHFFKNTGIKYDTDIYRASWDADLFRKESRFADLVIISKDIFFKDAFQSQPLFNMKEALRISECPVMLIPESFDRIDRLAFAYDGEKQSMHAIRQFVYLFPELLDLAAEIVHMNSQNADQVPEHNLLREYTSAHFQAQYTSELHFDAARYFGSWLQDKKNICLVSGSFSRSAWSNRVHKSFSEHIIVENSCPIFISHSC